MAQVVSHVLCEFVLRDFQPANDVDDVAAGSSTAAPDLSLVSLASLNTFSHSHATVLRTSCAVLAFVPDPHSCYPSAL